MRRFYNAFPIRNALRAELTWTHYPLLIRVEEPCRREFYLTEIAEEVFKRELKTDCENSEPGSVTTRFICSEAVA